MSCANGFFKLSAHIFLSQFKKTHMCVIAILVFSFGLRLALSREQHTCGCGCSVSMATIFYWLTELDKCIQHYKNLSHIAHFVAIEDIPLIYNIHTCILQTRSRV